MGEPLSDTVKLKVSGLPPRLVNAVEGWAGKDLTIADLRKLWINGIAPNRLRNVGKRTWEEAKPILDSLGLVSPYDAPPPAVSLHTQIAGRTWIVFPDEVRHGTSIRLTETDLRLLLSRMEQVRALP